MDSTLAETIGVAAKQARRKRGLTQEDAAERAGISAEFYARIERGSTLPSVPTLYRIALALEVEADLLLGTPSAGGSRGAERAALIPAERPELRLLLRRLRKARPRTIRLLSILAQELERPRR